MRRVAFMLLAALTTGVALPANGTVRGTGPWMPFSKAAITPGAETITAGNQCTSNFVFVDTKHVYLGQAAHCAATGAATDTDGCVAEVLPLGTKVRIDGARYRGTLVYSSWTTMQRRSETRDEVCLSNDFALVRLSRFDARRVNPSVPHWGGPTALASRAPAGSPVFGYGNSGLWMGVDALHPHRGVVADATPKGWGVKVWTAPAGVSGDSGSAYLDSSGRALGVLSTLELAPVPAANNLSTLSLALRYLRNHTSLRVRLVPGTEPFTG